MTTPSHGPAPKGGASTQHGAQTQGQMKTPSGVVGKLHPVERLTHIAEWVIKRVFSPFRTFVAFKIAIFATFAAMMFALKFQATQALLELTISEPGIGTALVVAAVVAMLVFADLRAMREAAAMVDREREFCMLLLQRSDISDELRTAIEARIARL